MEQCNHRPMKNILSILGLLVLFITRPDSGSAQIFADFQVNEIGGPGGAIQNYADIAVDSSGNFVIVWEDHRNGAASDVDVYAQMYSPDGEPVGSNIRINDDASKEVQRYPSVSMNANGDFVVSWRDLRNDYVAIYAQRFLAGGKPVGDNFEVTDCDSTEGRFSVVSMNDNGQFVIIWDDYRHDYYNDIFGQLYDREGNALGDNFKVNDNVEEGWKVDYSLAIDHEGNFVVAWADGRNNLTRHDIYAQRFSADGEAVDMNFMVNDTLTDIAKNQTSVAVNDSGDFIISWIDRRDLADHLYGQCYDRAGFELSDNFRINADEFDMFNERPQISPGLNNGYVCVWRVGRPGNNDYCDFYSQQIDHRGDLLGDYQQVKFCNWEIEYNNSSIAVDPRGNYFAAWTDLRNNNKDIYGQRCAADGSPLGDNFIVNDDQGSSDQYLSSVDADNNGNFVVAWRDERHGNHDAYAQRFSKDGTALGANLYINEDDSTAYMPSNDALFVDGNGNFNVLCTSMLNYTTQLYVYCFLSDGTAKGNKIAVNHGSEANPDMAALGGNNAGHFVVVWATREWRRFKIVAQRFLPDGTQVGDNITVSDNQDDRQNDPKVALSDSGDLVIVWEEHDGVYARQYDREGLETGDIFKVDEGLDGYGERPDIAMHKDGNFIISWDQDYPDHIIDTWARIYSSDGTPLIESFRVNDDDGFFWHLYSSIAIKSDGDFMICWESHEEANDRIDVYAQCFSASGKKLGNNFRIPNSNNRDQKYPSLTIMGENIYTTWTDNRISGTGYDIWCTVIDWDEAVRRFQDSISDLEEAYQDDLPEKFYLGWNYPNPFNPSTIINYELRITNDVELSIYNLIGQKVATLVSERQGAGAYQVEWDASGFASGVYIYRLSAKSRGQSIVQSKKLVLMK